MLNLIGPAIQTFKTMSWNGFSSFKNWKLITLNSYRRWISIKDNPKIVWLCKDQGLIQLDCISWWTRYAETHKILCTAFELYELTLLSSILKIENRYQIIELRFQFSLNVNLPIFNSHQVPNSDTLNLITNEHSVSYYTPF